MNGYELTRTYFNFAYENPEKVRPNHAALYFHIIDQANRFGWKDKFSLPSSLAMEAIGIKSHNTYIKTLRDLIDWGFIVMIEESKNQYTANIIALSKFNKAQYKALDEANSLVNQNLTKHSESTVQSTDSILKQENKGTKNSSLKSGSHPTPPEEKSKQPTFEQKYRAFIDMVNSICEKETQGRVKRHFRGDTKSKRQFKARLADGYTGKDFEKAVKNMYRDQFHRDNNFKYATPELISRPDKLEKFINQ